MKIIKIKHADLIPENFTGIVEFPGDLIIYYKNGDFHRLDGPAIEFKGKYSHYWLNGKIYHNIYNWKKDVESILLEK